MKPWILPCLLLALLLAPLALVQAQSSTSKIVFERDGNIWRMNDDGGKKEQLTSGGLDSHPSLCATRNRIVFQRGEGDQANIAIMNRDGSGVQYLTLPQVLYVSDTDPDCDSIFGGPERIVFLSDRDSPSGNIYRMDLDGSNVVNLSFDEFNTDIEVDPAWCPNRGVVFARKDGFDFDVFLVNLNEVTLLPDSETTVTINDGDPGGPPQNPPGGQWGPRHDRYPACSPDGQFVAFTHVLTEDTSNPGDPEEGIPGVATQSAHIYKKNFNDLFEDEPGLIVCCDDTQSVVPWDYSDDYFPSWSPGGTQIVFARCCSTGAGSTNDPAVDDYEIYKIEADASSAPECLTCCNDYTLPLPGDDDCADSGQNNEDPDITPSWGE